MNDILVKIGADITDFSRKMSESNNALKNFGKANQQTFDSFKKVGTAAVGIGTMIGVGLGKSVRTAADFEAAMSQVKAISGATGGEFDSLRDKAIEMGNSTMFSASESADAMANLAQMGWETDQIMGGIEHTLNLAAAGGLELADSAMIMANSMNQFGMDASEADRVADVFAYTAANAGTDVTQLGDAMQYAGANAAAAGMSIEEASAFIGVLGDAGITGSKAGTSLNAMLRDLKQNSEDGAIAVGEQSVALYDAEGNMRNMPEVIGEIISATETMSNEQRDAALSTIFGDQALVGFNAIASKGADSVSDLADELNDSGGAAENMADEMKDNLLGALMELGSAFEGVQIAIGTALIPAILAVAEWLKSLADWFNNLSKRTKTFIAVGVALSAILLIVGGGFLLLVGFLPAILSGFAALKTVAIAVGAAIGGISAPILIVIGLIGALVAAIIFAWNKSETFRDIVTSAFNAIKEVISNVIDTVVDFVMEMWGFLVDWWEENNELIMRVADKVWTAIQDVIQVVMEFLAPFLETAWENIKDNVLIVWEFIKTGIENALTIITGIIKAVMQVIDGDWSGAWETIKEMFLTVWDNMKEFLSKVTEIIKGIIKRTFTTIKENITDRLTEAKDNLIQRFNEMKQNAIDKVMEILSNVRQKFEEIKQNITNKITEAKNNLVSRFTEMVTNAINKAQEIVNTVRDKFEEVKARIREKLSEAVIIVGEKISEMPGKVKEFVGDMLLAGGDLIQGLIDGITNMGKKAIEAITGVVNGVVEKAKSLLEVKSPSRVFMEIGRFTGEGLADGITESIRMVERASERMTDAIIPDEQNIDLSYATPSGIKSSLSSAVSGTVDVNSREDLLARSINSLERKLTNLEVVMDGRQVGRIVEPHVTERQEQTTRTYNKCRLR